MQDTKLGTIRIAPSVLAMIVSLTARSVQGVADMGQVSRAPGRVLQRTNTEKQDVVAVAVHGLAPLASGEYALKPEQIFSNWEAELFSKVVNVAEKAAAQHVTSCGLSCC